jgi:hypothetical protein
LGVGILRLYIDPNFDFGFNDENRQNYRELEDYNTLLRISKRKMSILDENFVNSDDWFCMQQDRFDGTKTYVIYHPLWRKQSVRAKTGLTAANDVKMYNIFNLLRSDIEADNE